LSAEKEYNKLPPVYNRKIFYFTCWLNPWFRHRECI